MNYIKHSVYPLVLLFLLPACFSASAFTAKDADTMAGAFNNVFYSVNGTNGYIKDTQTGGVAYFWGQAEMIECVIDAYEWTTNTTYKGMITNLLNGFIKNNGSTWTYNIYNDDIMWAVIAFARGGLETGNTNYCNIARANFDACYARAWDNTLGGGLYWTTGNYTKNACVNGPGSIAASLLYQIYGDTAYLNKATACYNWERSVLFNATSGAIYDAIGTNGVINYWSSTYNQGTFIGAANFLGLTNDAALAANYTMANMTSGGILPEYGIAGNNSGFNAIFLRWMTRFVKDRHLQSTYEPWLQRNATAAWNMRRADNLSWCQWHQPSPAGTNFYAWDCVSSFEAMMAADPTEGSSSFSVPSGYNGYWPLDATSGTVAVDASGNGNDGTVNSASWNSSGKINGCLFFNGVNSSVQVNNTMNGDFSIVFWVKTTQTAGTGQWYNGAGLVDGDAPFNNNDFGTALVGGKFAFGVGNPDTTILSTTAINNGAWHQCVATRQQVTGVIKVYVDGSLQATGTGNKNSLNATSHLLFGAIASGGGYFVGSLDEIKFYARTLSSDEVAALYNCRTVPPAAAPANLTATAGNGQVQLNWWSAPNSTSYNVKRSLTNGGAYLTIT
ncbi:MAG TPA: glycoside hydrolase family 76 protein, partial [Candidatus Binatia bacterium]|nr:glycoside hydrolase family 76 protein [Candidatus Binatia bacterium]